MTTTVQDVIFPSASLIAVTKHDTNELPVAARKLYIGTGGSVKVQDIGGNDVTFMNVSDGTEIGPFFVHKIYNTGTTASNIVAYI